MTLAIEEGKKGAGFVSPNPQVGCVILDRGGALLSVGFHARLGEAHAEVNALKAIQDPRSLEGATVYVTLEPCAHEGRTPSCAKNLAKLPIASVVFGLIDPNPLVAGQGAEILRAAGKEVEQFAELQEELEELSEIFFVNQKYDRPFVALKVASSLDGKIALADGSSQWITGESSREHVHHLRGCYDAVLAGAGTILKDDPRLNSRDPMFSKKNQKVVVLDPEGSCVSRLRDSKLLQVRDPYQVILITKPGIQVQVPVNHVEMTLNYELGGEGRFPLSEVLACLQSENIYSIFVEGGASTYASFLNAKLVDRLYVFIAPKIIGEGLSWTSNLAASKSIQDSISRVQVRRFNQDTLFTGRIFN